MINPNKDGKQEYYNEHQRDYYCYPDDFNYDSKNSKRSKNCTLYMNVFYEDKFLIAEIRALIWAATGYDISRPKVNKLIECGICTGMLSYIRNQLRDPNSEIWDYICSVNDHGTVLNMADSIMDMATLQSNDGRYISEDMARNWTTKNDIGKNDMLGYSLPSRRYTGNENKVLADMNKKDTIVPGLYESMKDKMTFYQR